MKTKKLGKTLGLWAVLAGSIFLISPMFAVVDVLPDFIGYALILFGVSKLADINDKIALSAKYFRRLVMLGLARMFAILLVYGMSSPVERPTLQLLCSFVLCLLDCITLIPAWKNLSAGLLYLSTRHGGQAVFDKAYGQKRPTSQQTLLERVTQSTIVFLIAREVFSVLPEFSVLNSEHGGADVSLRVTLYDFIGFMRLVCGIIVLVWGIAWVVRFIRFCLHMGKDKTFFAVMTEKYRQEVLTRPELFARRSVKRAMVFMCVGVAFSVDFFLSELHTTPICVTPDFLMGLSILVGLLIIRRYVKGSKWVAATLSAAVYIPLALAEWIMQLSYMDVSDMRGAYYNINLYNRWTRMVGLRVTLSVMSVIMMFLLLRLLGDAIERYTGFSVSAYDSAHPNLRVKEIHRELKRRLWVVLGAGIVTAVASVVYIATLPIAADSLWELAGVVDTVVPLIYATIFVHATSQIFRQIDYKYMLS